MHNTCPAFTRSEDDGVDHCPDLHAEHDSSPKLLALKCVWRYRRETDSLCFPAKQQEKKIINVIEKRV